MDSLEEDEEMIDGSGQWDYYTVNKIVFAINEITTKGFFFNNTKFRLEVQYFEKNRKCPFTTISTWTEIAGRLGFGPYEFLNLVDRYGGCRKNNDIIFSNRKKAQLFIEEVIEPKLLMDKLTKG